jgi:hypothetical protein
MEHIKDEYNSAGCGVYFNCVLLVRCIQEITICVYGRTFPRRCAISTRSPNFDAARKIATRKQE